MNTYKVYQIFSQRELWVGDVTADDEEDAIYEAVQAFGCDYEFSESDFRVEICRPAAS